MYRDESCFFKLCGNKDIFTCSENEIHVKVYYCKNKVHVYGECGKN